MSQTKQKKLIQSVLGVHCACYDFRVVENESYTIDIPISAHIARWNLQTQKRVKTFELHDGVISSIQSYINPHTKTHFIATVAYDGMLKIWNASDYTLLCQTSTTHIPARVEHIPSFVTFALMHIKRTD